MVSTYLPMPIVRFTLKDSEVMPPPRTSSHHTQFQMEAKVAVIIPHEPPWLLMRMLTPELERVANYAGVLPNSPHPNQLCKKSHLLLCNYHRSTIAPNGSPYQSCHLCQAN